LQCARAQAAARGRPAGGILIRSRRVLYRLQLGALF